MQPLLFPKDDFEFREIQNISFLEFWAISITLYGTKSMNVLNFVLQVNICRLRPNETFFLFEDFFSNECFLNASIKRRMKFLGVSILAKI